MAAMAAPRPAPLLLVCSLAAQAFAAPSLAAQADADALAERLDAPFRASFPADEPGAAVVVSRAGETLLRRGYGLASLELQVAIEPDHVFCLASVTKPFTAMAVLALVEDGEIALTDPARRFLPDLELDERVTIEHLLSHTAGIPDFTTLPGFDHDHIHERVEPDELCRAAKGAEPSFAPGAEMRYGNVHYALLARIVEVVSERPWEEFVRARICEPAGMTRTAYGGHYRVVPGLVTAYAQDGDDDAWRRARPVSMTRGYGLGGLCSTVDDLARWADAFLAGRILAPATVARMQSTPTLADGTRSEYALGFYVREVRGHRFVYHAGGIYGWRAMVVLIPEKAVVCAVLTNRDSDDNRVANLATGAAALVAGRP